MGDWHDPYGYFGLGLRAALGRRQRQAPDSLDALQAQAQAYKAQVDAQAAARATAEDSEVRKEAEAGFVIDGECQVIEEPSPQQIEDKTTE